MQNAEEEAGNAEIEWILYRVGAFIPLIKADTSSFKGIGLKTIECNE